MASDIPAFLQAGTPVSAKFKGAFCEANIKSIKKLVKCKVLFKDASGSAVINNEFIEGNLKLGAVVKIKQGDGEPREATIQKMNDHSLYTVVFDDGDERTLRRTNVCVMGERHFQEHENLDNLPLTDPENFGTPVVLATDKRRKRKRSQPSIDDEDSDSDGAKPSKRWNEVHKEYLGKVVCIEQGERKKSWFPALGLKTYNKHSENQIYVQSFKDGKKLLAKKEDVKEFSKDKEPLISFFKGEMKIEPILKSAIEKALAYHDLGELPKGWNILDTIDEKDESSDEDVSLGPALSTEAKLFQGKVYEFLDRQGSPITKAPTINNQSVDLLKFYELVMEYGGMDEVTNQQWRSIYTQLGLRNIHTTASYNMKTLYKRYLFQYEEHMKSAAKSSPGRQGKSKSKRNAVKDDIDKSSTISESDSEPDRRRSTRSSRGIVEKLLSFDGLDKKKRSTVTMSDSTAEDSADRSSCSLKDISIEQDLDIKLSEAEDVDVVNSPQSSVTSEDNEAHESGDIQLGKYKPGARISVRYGSGKNQRTYNAKVQEVDKEENDEVVYFIHYNGWNHRYDEWIKDERIYGLSSNTPNNKRRHNAPPTPLTRIAKEPPPRFKNRMDSDIRVPSPPVPPPPPEPNRVIAEPKRVVVEPKRVVVEPKHVTVEPKRVIVEPKRVVVEPKRNVVETKRTVMDVPVPPKVIKLSTIPVIEKPPSPLKSPIHTQEPLFLSESIKLHSHSHLKQTHVHHVHRPKPITDALFIPDIKPSPIKPRTTRNSMQDTFLLNALEESIGKPNQAAMSLQQDVLLKAEPSRRRSNRQQNHSPKSDTNTESDFSSNNEKGSEDVAHSKKDVKTDSTPSSTGSEHHASNFDSGKIAPLDPKESSKEDTVKKWIEDSSKVLSKAANRKFDVERKDTIASVGDSTDVGLVAYDASTQEDNKPKRGRKPKVRKQEENKSRQKSDESDSENEVIKPEPVAVKEETEERNNNNLQSEKDRTSETAQTLSDFCNILENVRKLPNVSNSVNMEVVKEANASAKDSEKFKKKKHHEKHKRKRSHSINEGDGIKSPKKEKRVSPALEYNVDFMSDLEMVMAEKDPVERIVIMQSRLNAMRKLYSKLRTEVASIDRRKRRKLRKQIENKQKGNL